MKKMDSMTVLGLACGIIVVLFAIMSKGSLAIFFDPASILITLGGSFCAVLIRFQAEQMKMVFQITKNAFLTDTANLEDIVTEFVRLGKKARREGLLALEDDIEAMDDPFTRRGLQKVVDGLSADVIKEIMYIEIDSLENRHRLGQELFKFWAVLAPAFGMIGTLIGLVLMLTNLDDPNAIGPGMAVALLTTFYGSVLANLVFTPIAGKLEMRTNAEVLAKEAIIEAVLCIQAGTNPRIIEEKLQAFISPRNKELVNLPEAGIPPGPEEVFLHEK